MTMFLVGAHFGMHSIAGIFYPSAFRSNGAGWATSVAKIGSIIGPVIGGVVLSTHLPVRVLFAILAACPFAMGVAVFVLGRIQRRNTRLRGELAPEAPPAAGLAAIAESR
jgi:MFS transporter, AAHS family, 4-hydroxybenzoate transporter